MRLLVPALLFCAACAPATREAPPRNDARLADVRFHSALLDCPAEVERGSEGPLAVSVTNGLSTRVALYLDGCRKHERLGSVAPAGSRGFVLPRRYTVFEDTLRIHVYRDADGQRHETYNLPTEVGRFVPLSISGSEPEEIEPAMNRVAPSRLAEARLPTATGTGRTEETFPASTVWSVAGGAALTLSCRPNEGPTLVLSLGPALGGPVSVDVSFDGGEFVRTTDSWTRVRSIADALVAGSALGGELLERMRSGEMLVVRLAVEGEGGVTPEPDTFVFVPRPGVGPGPVSCGPDFG